MTDSQLLKKKLTVADCSVEDGQVYEFFDHRIIRNEVEVADTMSSKMFRNGSRVTSSKAGQQCSIELPFHWDVRIGDKIQAHVTGSTPNGGTAVVTGVRYEDRKDE